MSLPSRLAASWLVPALVPVVAGAIGWYGLWEPHTQRVIQLRATLRDEQQKTAVQRDIAERQAVVRAYRRRLPQSVDTDWLINQTAQAAGKVGLSLIAVTPLSAMTTKSGYTRISINVECAASYHELGRFIAQLESAEPFIRVDGVNLSQSAPDAEQATTAPGRRRALLLLSTMYLPSDAS